MKLKKIKIGGVWVDIKYANGAEHFPDGESGLALFNQHLIKRKLMTLALLLDLNKQLEKIFKTTNLHIKPLKSKQ